MSYSDIYRSSEPTPDESLGSAIFFLVILAFFCLLASVILHFFWLHWPVLRTATLLFSVSVLLVELAFFLYDKHFPVNHWYLSCWAVIAANILNLWLGWPTWIVALAGIAIAFSTIRLWSRKGEDTNDRH